MFQTVPRHLRGPHEPLGDVEGQPDADGRALRPAPRLLLADLLLRLLRRHHGRRGGRRRG